jgi:hypothetical protein
VKRSGALVMATAVSIALGGCGTLATKRGPAQPAPTFSTTPSKSATAGASHTPSRGPTPAPSDSPTPGPAALAGGACLLLDFDVINATLGVHFDVAAAADTSGSYSCVVRGTNTDRPDMVLSITATDLTAAEFKTDAQPDGAKAVANLGKIGYEIQKPPPADGGPVVEVGWLSGNDRLIVLDYAFEKGAPASEVAALTPKMISMARTVDATTV